MKLPVSLVSEGRAYDAIAVGENSMDLIAVVDAHPHANAKVPLLDYLELPGGEAASAAVGLARLGWRTRYVGRFGDDRLGRAIRETLIGEGVDVDQSVVVEHQANRLAVILVERAHGTRTVLWKRGDALALRPDDVSDATVTSGRIMLLGSDDVACMTAAAKRARKYQVRTVGDLERVHPGTSELLRQLDVIMMAATFPEEFTGEPTLGRALREIARASRAPLVCVTLGEEGCLAVVDGREVAVPAFRIDAVDTTGAGDLFRAGLISRWLANPEHPDVEDLLRYASAVAALNCRAVGAQTAAPRPQEVDALLNA